METSLPTRRWALPCRNLLGIAGAVFVSLLAVAFSTVAAKDLTCLLVAAFLWVVAGRTLWLTFRNATYELVIEKHSMHWGWEHAQERHVRVDLIRVGVVRYERNTSAEDTARITFVLMDGNSIKLPGYFAERPAVAEQVLGFLGSHFTHIQILRD